MNNVINSLILPITSKCFNYLKIKNSWEKCILPGGNDCFSFSAFSLSVITNVYKNLEHRTLNLVFSVFFFILTAANNINEIMQFECVVTYILHPFSLLSAKIL